jgi:hypothetical protein
MSNLAEPLPQLRFAIVEAARILRMTRATLYQRIQAYPFVTRQSSR